MSSARTVPHALYLQSVPGKAHKNPTLWFQKSLKHAAEFLHLTQPAISKTLKELEEIAGVTLLERGRGGVLITPEGEVFLRHAATSLNALDQALNSVSALQKGEQGSLAVGALPSVAARLMPLATQIFKQDFPHITLLLEGGQHSFLVDRLRRND
ncbi:LysR family transcriptional regulator [Pararhizobium sp. IMCC21322]|uniref:LysR family transcriptional regulator n=1 Tax=Pararhizobium sp. IMCC21322 TaxID=3067903 RepID=UPI002742413F|nr:LysR family transcriptional regulator [Pararhizobium sp. IMCC21322]